MGKFGTLYRPSTRGDCSKVRLRPGGGTPHMKGLGMFVVSLRGVNFGFWSHLGCSGQNTIIFSRLGLHVKKYKNIYILSVISRGLF